MIFVVVGEARPTATLEQIQANRQAYVTWEAGSSYAGMYRTLARYEVVGASPKKTFWVMQADDPVVIHELVEHFADVWQITAYPVVQRTIGEAA
ncbi:MAG: hypothetical protein IT317_14160 [Anaerolineales bacterium]|nr:hypothetical protein [Anaerolineales bacterium]